MLKRLSVPFCFMFVLIGHAQDECKISLTDTAKKVIYASAPNPRVLYRGSEVRFLGEITTARRRRF